MKDALRVFTRGATFVVPITALFVFFPEPAMMIVGVGFFGAIFVVFCMFIGVVIEGFR